MAWEYVGHGEFLIGVPPRELSDEEAEIYGTSSLEKSGLYRRKSAENKAVLPTKTAENKSENYEADYQESLLSVRKKSRN